MAPANEGFRTDQAAIRQTDLRLIEQFEFVALGGKHQFGLERQAGFQLLPDRALEDHVAAAPGRLGAAKRQMAVGQKFVGGPAALRIDRRPDTDLDAMLPRSGQKRGVERKRDAFGQLRDRLGGFGAGDRDGEFVAAQARDQRRAAGLRVQSLGHRTQHEVAAGVAEHVVDLLEGVEADHQQRDLAPLPSAVEIIAARPS